MAESNVRDILDPGQAYERWWPGFYDAGDARMARVETVRVRTADDLQRAHDLLWPLVMGEVPFPVFRPGDVCGPLSLRAALDVLCWALGPEHNDENTSFADNLRKIEGVLLDYGVVLQRRPE